MKGQLSIFDLMNRKRKITPVKSKQIDVLGNRIPIKVGEIYEVVVEHSDMVSIRTYNAFGGSFGFPVTYKQMEENFRDLIT